MPATAPPTFAFSELFSPQRGALVLRPLFPVCCGCSMCFPSEESLVTHPQWQRPECHCDMERRDLRDGHSLARHKEAKE